MNQTIWHKRKLFPVLLIAHLYALSQPVAGPNLLQAVAGGGYCSPIMTKRNLNHYLYHFPTELKCGISYHNYLPYRQGIIAQIDGSGIVYQAAPGDAAFRRMDSTCYEGYNFGAATFVFRDTLFSLGGYGAWTLNGVLRYFDLPTRQWAVIPVNQRIEFSQKANAFTYFDPKEGRLYIIYRKEKDIYLKEAAADAGQPYVQCLDLKSRNWWVREKPLSKGLSVYRNPLMLTTEIHTPWGVMMESPDDVHNLKLYDFARNEIREPDARLQTAIRELLASRSNLAHFVKDSILHVYFPEQDSLVKVPLNLEQFSKPVSTLYIESAPVPAPKKWPIALMTVILLVLCAGIGFMLYRRRGTTPLSLKTAPVIVVPKEQGFSREHGFAANLTEQEKPVFELLLANSLKNQPTTIDAINRVLGVKQKDHTIQNKLRSDIFKALNQKFQVYAATADELVERERTEFDKRVFQYRINQRYLKKLS